MIKKNLKKTIEEEIPKEFDLMDSCSLSTYIPYINKGIANVSYDVRKFLNNAVDREIIVQKIANALNFDVEIAEKVEAGIYEYTLIYGLQKKFLNDLLPSIYNCKAIDLVENLTTLKQEINSETQKPYKTFKKKILTGKLDPQTVSYLTPQELNPVQWEKPIEKAQLREYKKKNMATTDLYECEKCLQWRCQVLELQIRSADEPATRIITCVVCQHVMHINN